MKCPKCAMVFEDYDGCNAIRCGNPNCKAAFCAVCLQYCEGDAHAHVRSHHGDLYDKDDFHRGKKARELDTVNSFTEEIKEEPFEVKELFKIHCQRAFPDSSRTGEARGREAKFINDAKQGAKLALQNDRLSLLSDPEEHGQQPFRIDIGKVSPRNAVPEEYQLCLHANSLSSPACKITLK